MTPDRPDERRRLVTALAVWRERADRIGRGALGNYPREMIEEVQAKLTALDRGQRSQQAEAARQE